MEYSPLLCNIEVKYSIKAETGSPAGVYDFSVRYKIYKESWWEYFTLNFKVGIDVPDISILPLKFPSFIIITSFKTPGPAPEDLAFDGQFLWCADRVDDKIYKLDTAGNVISSINSPNVFPGGLAFDGTYLWNADSSDKKIYKLDTSGNLIGSFDSLGPSPRGLAFDGKYLWNIDSFTKKYTNWMFREAFWVYLIHPPSRLKALHLKANIYGMRTLLEHPEKV